MLNLKMCSETSCSRKNIFMWLSERFLVMIIIVIVIIISSSSIAVLNKSVYTQKLGLFNYANHACLYEFILY